MRRRSSSVVPSPRSSRFPGPDDFLQKEFTGPIRRAHERTRGDVREAHRLAGLAKLVERLRRDVLLDRQVPAARPQVLSEGQDVDLVCTKIAHRGDHFLAGLAETEHDRGLREEIIPHPLRGPEDLQTLCVIRAAVTNGCLETLDGLDVVIEDIHTRIDDGSHGLEVPLEVRDERFHEQLRAAGLDLPHGLCEVAGAAVREVVPIDGRQHDVGKVQFREGHRDLLRLAEIEGAERVPRLHGAEPAAPGAGVPHEHDRRGPAPPALPHVRAVGFFAHGVKVEGPEQGLQMDVVLARGWADPKPLGLPFGEHRAGFNISLRLCILTLEPQKGFPRYLDMKSSRFEDVATEGSGGDPLFEQPRWEYIRQKALGYGLAAAMACVALLVALGPTNRNVLTYALSLGITAFALFLGYVAVRQRRFRLFLNGLEPSVGRFIRYSEIRDAQRLEGRRRGKFLILTLVSGTIAVIGGPWTKNVVLKTSAFDEVESLVLRGVREHGAHQSVDWDLDLARQVEQWQFRGPVIAHAENAAREKGTTKIDAAFLSEAALSNKRLAWWLASAVTATARAKDQPKRNSTPYDPRG